MKVSKRIRIWARIGQTSWWLYVMFCALWELQYNPFESAGITAQILAIGGLVFAVLITEAIVRLIVYFAELLELLTFKE